MKIKPLTGQVLVSVLPRETMTDAGIHIPDTAQDGEAYGKKKPFKAKVVALGPWKQTKTGFGILPDFGTGSTVLCNPYAGTKLAREIGENLILVSFEDILAKIES